jgi:hypothetical protein
MRIHRTRTGANNMWQKFSNFFQHFDLYGRGIVVGIASHNGLDGLGIESQVRETLFSRPERASCALGIGSFRWGGGGVTGLGLVLTTGPVYCPTFAGGLELYLCLPSVPVQAGHRVTFIFPSFKIIRAL